MLQETSDLKYFQFKGLLQKEGWIQNAFVGVDKDGIIQYISHVSPKEIIGIEFIHGFALPGFQNSHSHAFQYAIAGLAETHRAGIHDDFWTWREAMYQCALSVDPDQMQAIAAMLYAEMLRHGYTHVAEFHYLHHDKTGKPYNNIVEMGERLLIAANTAGIKITLIPVFYQKGGFGKAPSPQQCRFISKTIDDYFNLLQATEQLVAKYDHAKLGFSVHSLRAVEPEHIVTTIEQGPKTIPFHIHIAEQKKEVEECIAFLKARPASWLLNNTNADERFHVVHATHLDNEELSGLVKMNVNVILCPSTEGNLGDGFFRMKDFVKANGKWCIGTDSNIGLNPLEEFRMIDYRQRLLTNQRNVIDNNYGAYFIQSEIENGRKATGVHGLNYFEVGRPLDAIVYNADSPLLASTSLNNILNTLIYAADASSSMGTLVNGKWVVKGSHIRFSEIQKQFTSAMHSLNNR